MLCSHEPIADPRITPQPLQIEMPRAPEKLVVGVSRAEVIAVLAVRPVRGHVSGIASEVAVSERDRAEIGTRWRRAAIDDRRELVRSLRDDDDAAIAVVVRAHGGVRNEWLCAEYALRLAAAPVVAPLPRLDDEEAAHDLGLGVRMDRAQNPDR